MQRVNTHHLLCYDLTVFTYILDADFPCLNVSKSKTYITIENHVEGEGICHPYGNIFCKPLSHPQMKSMIPINVTCSRQYHVVSGPTEKRTYYIMNDGDAIKLFCVYYLLHLNCWHFFSPSRFSEV